MPDQPTTISQSDEKPFLSPPEARVLASLMEKQLATPKYYPMTPNALTQACNQKSSREPVMNLNEGEVRHILNLLEHRRLVKVDSGDRTYRISHRMKQALNLEHSELAVLTVLMLRFPQTLNDILRRTARMVEFSDADEVQLVVESMIERDQPLAVLLPKGPGQREDRYWHTLCGKCKDEYLVADKKEGAKESADDRFARFEDRLEQLESKMDAIIRQIEQLSSKSH